MAENQKKKIVIVEDEEILLNLLKKKLEGSGYEVMGATDGEMGLRIIEESHPDMVLLDMLLPKKNGFAVLEELHNKGLLPAIPLLIISNSGQPIEVERAKELGIRDYLIKLNFDPDEVLAKVNNILRGEAMTKSSEAPVSPTSEVPKNKLENPRGKPSILIVEDDTLLAGLLGRKLEQEGFRVFQAVNVPQAREVLEANSVGAICLDIILPGIDGFTYLRELKESEKFKKIPVLILSNLGQQEEIDAGLKMGAVDYIIKATMSPQEIADKLSALVVS